MVTATDAVRCSARASELAGWMRNASSGACTAFLARPAARVDWNGPGRCGKVTATGADGGRTTRPPATLPANPRFSTYAEVGTRPGLIVGLMPIAAQNILPVWGTDGVAAGVARTGRVITSAASIMVAVFSGIMSACFAFALTAGNPINDASLAAGTNPVFQGLPRLIVVLLGGFTTNFIWCVMLNVKNRTGYQYFQSEGSPCCTL